MSSIKQTILERLNTLGIKPSKGLGQNFLVDGKAYDKIVAAAELKPGEMVLEIGPGLGTLTERLVATGAQVVTIEKDRKLIEFLNKLFDSRVKIVEADVLKFDPKELGLKEGKYKIVANIPYYITGQLLKNIYELWPQPSAVIFLLQKEVAQRIVTKPPHSNVLALTTQYFARPKIIAYVSRHNFYPAPKVDSAIIKLTTRTEQLANGEEIKELFRVIKIGFSSKRKKLSNNLSNGLKVSKEKINAILRELGIAENTRPENLTLEQWQQLTPLITKLSNKAADDLDKKA